MKLFYVFLTTILVFISTTASHNCKCKFKKHQMKCNAFANRVDVCFFCQKDECGKIATSVYFALQETNNCLVKDLLNCCPNINTIILDNERLCSCYCSMKSVTVNASGTTGFASCKACKSTSFPPKTTQNVVLAVENVTNLTISILVDNNYDNRYIKVYCMILKVQKCKQKILPSIFLFGHGGVTVAIVSSVTITIIIFLCSFILGFCCWRRRKSNDTKTFHTRNRTFRDG